MGYRTTNLPEHFGNGSDGALHLQANATMDQGEYHLSSLTIDEGITWQAPKWSVDFIPIVILRCRTPIVLNGKISASGVTAYLDASGNLVDTAAAARSGYGPSLGDGAYPGPLFSFVGGGSLSHTAMVYESATERSLGYTAAQINSYENGSSIWKGMNREVLVGPTGLYRYGAGGGGSTEAGQTNPGIGGGILILCAPAIRFGANAAIEAKGISAAVIAGQNGSGGGGGGHIECWTRTALSDIDWAKVSVAGGSGSAAGAGAMPGLAGGSGLDGFKIRKPVAS
jgi:hypothetical protein